MTERAPGEPGPMTKQQAETAYLIWCVMNRLDPDLQESARAYEEWWERMFPLNREESG